MPGMRCGKDGGARNANVVIKVALQVGVAAPATAMHVTAAPSAAVPFLNCTVPDGLAPLPVPETVAVSITLPPPAGRLVGEAVAVVVVCSPTASGTPADVEVA